MKKSTSYFVSDVATSAGASVVINSFNVFLFAGRAYERWVIVRSLVFFTIYDLTASIGVFVPTRASINLNWNTGATTDKVSRNSSFLPAAGVYSSDIFYRDMNLLIGDCTNVGITASGNIYPGVAAAGINSNQIQFSCIIDLVTRQELKDYGYDL